MHVSMLSQCVNYDLYALYLHNNFAVSEMSLTLKKVEMIPNFFNPVKQEAVQQ